MKNLIKEFVKDQKINLALLGIAICLGSMTGVGENYLQYAVIIKLSVIAILFALSKCLYILASNKKSKGE